MHVILSTSSILNFYLNFPPLLLSFLLLFVKPCIVEMPDLFVLTKYSRCSSVESSTQDVGEVSSHPLTWSHIRSSELRLELVEVNKLPRFTVYMSNQNQTKVRHTLIASASCRLTRNLSIWPFAVDNSLAINTFM